MNKIILIAAITSFTVIASSCASKAPSFGQSIEAEGKAVSGLGTQWDKGQAMIKKGNKLIRKGNKQISQGKEDLADGNALVKSGERLVSDAEKAYGKVKTPE